MLNSKKILVVSPHADDETLGAGGTLLRAKDKSIKLYWLLVTSPNKQNYSETYIKNHIKQVEKIKNIYNFEKTLHLNYTPALLENEKKSSLINNFYKAFKSCKADTIIIPHISDAHTDHYVTHTCCMAACKIFKFNELGLRKIYSMEVLSETDIFTSKKDYQFQANTWINISNYINQKIEAFSIYKTEVHKKGPRSNKYIRAQSKLHGSNLGWNAAERFCLLYNIDE